MRTQPLECLALDTTPLTRLQRHAHVCMDMKEHTMIALSQSAVALIACGQLLMMAVGLTAQVRKRLHLIIPICLAIIY